MINLYKVLGVQYSATLQEIRRAYIKKAKSTHPDKNPKLSRSKFQKINEAHRVLTDPILRKSHDRDLKRGYAEPERVLPAYQAEDGSEAQLRARDFVIMVEKRRMELTEKVRGISIETQLKKKAEKLINTKTAAEARAAQRAEEKLAYDRIKHWELTGMVPDVENGVIVYEMDKILDKKSIEGVIHYLVKWDLYPLEQATWEPLESFNSMDMVNNYEKSMMLSSMDMSQSLDSFQTSNQTAILMPKIHKCLLCGKFFNKQDTLLKHKQTHKELRCLNCKQRFTRYSSLKRHIDANLCLTKL